MKERRTIGNLIFDTLNILALILLMICTLYPFLYIALGSVSEPDLLRSHEGLLFSPLGLQFDAYNAVLSNSMILIGYRNTIIYVVLGTMLNVMLTAMMGFALSRRGPLLVNGIMFAIVITMFFGGGLIPTYLVMKQIGLINSWFSVIFPGLISTYNLIIMRTHFQSMPIELEESAKIDGANDLMVLFRIMLPLSLPILSVMMLYYGVGHWNAWFNASIYLSDSNKYPLQLVLRNILTLNSTDDTLVGLGSRKGQDMNEIVKYACIMVSTLPIVMVYPFLQKYFVKGVMIGSIKG
ncbi:carbohydrate ABC transporter permease [Bacillus sp. 3255]|uniref:carbohydrate ABC transporter permease n=1 Tax=Bacillus sp. 3255 TaxID=2817904 RepID=UPI002860EE58|nr:carbohydrate ABC transporter permease [Bacillus sp. 3255]MDR6882426.1 putative aldouronate transport system permease protein [Bacillus sp. 3255]